VRAAFQATRPLRPSPDDEKCTIEFIFRVLLLHVHLLVLIALGSSVSTVLRMSAKIVTQLLLVQMSCEDTSINNAHYLVEWCIHVAVRSTGVLWQLEAVSS